MMKPHESPRIRKKQFVAIRAIRGLCGIGGLRNKYILLSHAPTLFNEYLLWHNESDNNGSHSCKDTILLLIYKDN